MLLKSRPPKICFRYECRPGHSWRSTCISSARTKLCTRTGTSFPPKVSSALSSANLPLSLFDRSVLREATDAGGDVALVFAVKRCCCKAKRSRKCILSASSSMSASPAVTREVGVSVGVGGSKLASSEEPGITGAGCAVKAASSSRSVEGGIAKVAV